jgi:AsmA protein
MRNFKVLGGLAAGIVVLLGAALVGVWLLVNPNQFKGRIAAAVKESTGRELQLTGDIKLSVFPWIALELGPATLGNPPGFSEEPFLSLAHASVRVKLLPLLRERLEVARVDVDGLNVRLRKNAQGRGNWQDAELSPTVTADADHAAARAARPGAPLARLHVQHGRVSYEGMTFENITLETGAAVAARVVPVRATFDANRGIPGEQISMTAQFDLSEDAQALQWQLAAVNFSGTLTRARADRPTHWDLSAPILQVNLAQQTLAVPAFALSYAGAHVNGQVSATRILDDLSLTGSAILPPLVLREFAPRLGITLPTTRDAKALSALSASTAFSYGANAVSLSNMNVRLDDTALQGHIQFHPGGKGAIEFDLTADRIDLDRYRAPQGATADPHSAADDAGRSATPLDARGTFRLNAAHVARMDLSSLRINLIAEGNVIHLFPIEAQIDGGRYSGDITLDRRGAVPTLTVDEHLTGVDMARLLAGTAQKGRLSGRATLNLKATARGATLDAFLKTLSGHLDANLAQGALEGIDVAYEMGLARALIDKSAAPPRENTGHTPFEVFQTSAQIANGVAETHDLTIASSVLKVSGQGRANLSSKAIDFKLLAAVATAPARTTDIPLKVTGTYTDPTVRPDIEAAAKDQLKQKLQDVLKKNGLEKLFSK